ncbi:hypothetical protein P4233_05665 [Pseudomonas aeruginosa]|nr:hypothetical protein [Pseudomonas aeruginosa]
MADTLQSNWIGGSGQSMHAADSAAEPAMAAGDQQGNFLRNTRDFTAILLIRASRRYSARRAARLLDGLKDDMADSRKHDLRNGQGRENPVAMLDDAASSS